MGSLHCGREACRGCPDHCLWNTWEFRTLPPTVAVEGQEDTSAGGPREELVLVGKKHKNTSRGHAPITYAYESGGALEELMHAHLEHGHQAIVSRMGRTHSRSNDAAMFLSGHALPFNDATFCQVCYALTLLYPIPSHANNIMRLFPPPLPSSTGRDFWQSHQTSSPSAPP